MTATAHDPICIELYDELCGLCTCDLIARVRADERERCWQEFAVPRLGTLNDYHAGYDKGVADERERAAERVAAAPSWKPDPIPDTLAIWLDDAVTAARGGE